jgi:hypothetical protein
VDAHGERGRVEREEARGLGAGEAQRPHGAELGRDGGTTARTCARVSPRERRKAIAASGRAGELRCENRGAALAALSGWRPQVETR